MAVFLQSCGTTKVGIEAMSTLGECQNMTSLRKIKINLAVKDEKRVKDTARRCIMSVVFDNMDRKINRVLQHKTLPVLLFLELPIPDGIKTNGKALEDVVHNYRGNAYILSHNKLKEERDAFKLVIYTVLGELIEEIPNKPIPLTITVNDEELHLFPKNHPHKYQLCCSMLQ